MPERPFQFFIPWQPGRTVRGKAQQLHLFADEDVPKYLIDHLRTKHRLRVDTAADLAMRQTDDLRIANYCLRKGLILVSFNVKDYWRIDPSRSFGMILIDIDKSKEDQVKRAVDAFMRHNGRTGRSSFRGGMLRLNTGGYVTRFSIRHGGKPHIFAVRYSGDRLEADFMAMPGLGSIIARWPRAAVGGGISKRRPSPQRCRLS